MLYIMSSILYIKICRGRREGALDLIPHSAICTPDLKIETRHLVSYNKKTRLELLPASLMIRW
jgi:hypothetical protein